MTKYNDAYTVISKGRRAKVLLLIAAFFLIGASLINAQVIDSPDTLELQKIVIKKSKDDKRIGNSERNYFFLAFNYDFGDSVSIFIGRRNIYTGRLKYFSMDTNATAYPYARSLLKFSIKNITSKRSKCYIRFWESRKEISFGVDRKNVFYTLDISKNKPLWNLNISNTYPWPD